MDIFNVIGTELDVLKAVKKVGKKATTPIISGKVGISTGYADMLVNSLMGKNLVEKTAKGGLRLTTGALKAFGDILGVEAGVRRKGIKKAKKKPKKTKKKPKKSKKKGK